jgi:hypothetical protein
MLAELILEMRPQRAGLDSRRVRGAVDLEHTVETAKVDRHRPRISAADPRLDPTHHAGAPAERNHGEPLLGAPVEHLLDLALVPRMGDQVRWVLDPAAKAPHHVAVRFAERVGDALVGIGSKDAGERRRRVDPRRRQLDRLQRDGLLDLIAAEPELLPDPGCGRFELRPGGLRVLEPPAPVLSPADGRVYQ